LNEASKKAAKTKDSKEVLRKKQQELKIQKKYIKKLYKTLNGHSKFKPLVPPLTNDTPPLKPQGALNYSLIQ
jgi:ribosome-associated toxin RatA of RatAB toxin-antitoxin module